MYAINVSFYIIFYIEPTNEEEHRSEALQAHVIGIPVAPTPVTALVTPRIDVTGKLWILSLI